MFASLAAVFAEDAAATASSIDDATLADAALAVSAAELAVVTAAFASSTACEADPTAVLAFATAALACSTAVFAAAVAVSACSTAISTLAIVWSAPAVSCSSASRSCSTRCSVPGVGSLGATPEAEPLSLTLMGTVMAIALSTGTMPLVTSWPSVSIDTSALGSKP